MNKLFLILTVLSFSCTDASEKLSNIYFVNSNGQDVFQLYTGIVNNKNFEKLKNSIPDLAVNQLLKDGYELQYFVKKNEKTNENNILVNIFQDELKLQTYPVNTERMNYSMYETDILWTKNDFTENEYVKLDLDWFVYLSENAKFTNAKDINEYSGSNFQLQFTSSKEDIENNQKLTKLVKKMLLGIKFKHVVHRINFEEKCSKFPLLTIEDTQDGFKNEINNYIDNILKIPQGIELFYEIIQFAMLGFNSKSITISPSDKSRINFYKVLINTKNNEVQTHAVYDKNGKYQCMKYILSLNFVGLFHELTHFVQTPYILKRVSEKYKKGKFLENKLLKDQSLKVAFRTIINFYDSYAIKNVPIYYLLKCLSYEICSFQENFIESEKCYGWMNSIVEFSAINGEGYEAYKTMEYGNNNFLSENNFLYQLSKYTNELVHLRQSHNKSIITNYFKNRNQLLKYNEKCKEFMNPEDFKVLNNTRIPYSLEFSNKNTADAFYKIIEDYATYDPKTKFSSKYQDIKYFDIENCKGLGRNIQLPEHTENFVKKTLKHVYEDYKNDYKIDLKQVTLLDLEKMPITKYYNDKTQHFSSTEIINKLINWAEVDYK